ncbi:P-type DNA transfer ATPase VirB11 [Marinobacterium arenosum]|uniref:P-type DNA transfer ATPase VirB11 n=1 Tax=Marinobacterium arenosum TaxID=2862496 RepID=UPI001C97E6AA|nr:P-type DNA transfer ATPase VirB11 [Marinobacterium arenosum]MBY4677956.1 P-type DNA transfer ATPase VirB11 [Marinobacterium arenosum]
MTSNLSSNSAPLLEYLEQLRPFLLESRNTEVCINQPGEVVIEGADGWKHHAVPEITFDYCRQLAKLIATFSQQRLDEQEPLMSATLPGGERIQVVIPPATRAGTVSLTIRKPSDVRITLDDYEKAGAFDECVDFSTELSSTERDLLALKKRRQFRAFLELAVRAKKNIIISGSTGSGKTTLMKSLLSLVPEGERLLSIENVDELGLYKTHPNAVSLFYSAGGQGVANTTQQHLLECSLRMKPDRIFLAELIRGDEAFYYLRNVNSGHPGSITSMHANSARLAMEQLVLFLKESASGHSMSRADIKQLLLMCVDIIVQIKNVGGRRMITEIFYDPESQRRQMV